jgi:N-acetylglutamate synthase-like GNAT family acetyltransferase
MQFDKITYYDLEQIGDLQPEGWRDIKEEFLRYVKNDFCNPVKVSLDNKIIGLGTSILFRNTAWMAHVIVGKEYRNQGIGSQIIDNLLTDLKSKSIESVLLIATELGEPVYKKAGFRPVTDYIWF